MKAEGWYIDPYGRHEARWFSDGTPTDLVRDRGVTSDDPPPSTPYTAKLEPITQNTSSRSDGLQRADHNQDLADDPRVASDAVWEIFDETSGQD